MKTTGQLIAEFYDDEYADELSHGDDVALYLSKLPRKSQRVLSLACGTGRDAIPLAQAGHRVTGVDIDPAMIARAVEKRDAIGVSPKQLDLRVQDLRALRVPGTFDHAAMIFTTFVVFTTLAEQDRVLTNVRKHLKRGGTIWIDVFSPDTALHVFERQEDISPSVFFSRSLGRTVERRVTLWPDARRVQVQHIRFDYRWHDDAGAPKRKSVQFANTWFHPRELQLLLERNGFDMIDFFGDHDGGPVTPRSPRLIAWARKK